ncbi:hypothetical protein CH249_14075 [Rhodococcus sp. 05-2255-3B1]|uniref:hypothetical protein n=1 Tax=unclassified Rhodococcus (in: high G+C Gram-positive bacteria) TaxID=192944 RepID=UPI000B9B6268|nr:MULTISPECIES: hypothetical protein [unclassified Rhodococcus (in: high G+C Gram-positive bacteria)]OZE10207.1 hypothetical protein CH249_14075 [Rhodococcus sp. 05-2255-3B1]OZE13623.1 hypothetical protein CH250_07060 [Rhodococcus sp. 05-2255-3C]OZE13710.1 hypothetical protein CH255_23865 [Rhodococcus sp. 05-2255-2A2]
MADTDNTQPSAQPIEEWTDSEGRKHFAGRGTFAHQAREAEEALAAERKTESAEPSDDDQSATEVAAPPVDVKTAGDVAAAPAELTSTPGGRPAGPPKAAPKSS